jgi:hypothetical protein
MNKTIKPVNPDRKTNILNYRIENQDIFKEGYRKIKDNSCSESLFREIKNRKNFEIL